MILCVQAESSIAKLRKKEGELEAAAQKGEGGKTEEEDTKEPKHQSLAQIIYADNRVSALSFAQECGLVFDGCDFGIEIQWYCLVLLLLWYFACLPFKFKCINALCCVMLIFEVSIACTLN